MGSVLTLKWFRHIKLFHNAKYNVFIIVYNDYLPKISKLKNQVPKLRIKNNYFAICCQNGKGTMVVAK
jgi:hypothetical protein